MINRAAIILKGKEPFVNWINDADPTDNPDVTLTEINEECTVYLISDYDGENVDEWISKNYSVLFENELEDWYVDESLWPEKRDRATFDNWFSVEFHSMVIDTIGGPIVDDGE